MDSDKTTQRSDTADYFAQLVKGGLQNSVNLPGILNGNFSLPGYTGQLGQGINQSQQDMLGMTNNVLSRYFGGGYSAGAPGYGGIGGTGGTGGTGGEANGPGVPWAKVPPGIIDFWGQNGGMMNGTGGVGGATAGQGGEGFAPFGDGSTTYMNTMMDPNSLTRSDANRFIPGFNPSDPTTWGPQHLPTSYLPGASNTGGQMPTFGGLQPTQNLPGLGNPSMSPMQGQVPGSNNILAQLFQTMGNNPGAFNSQITGLINGGPGNTMLGNLATGQTAGQSQLSQLIGSQPGGQGLLAQLAGQSPNNQGANALMSLFNGGGSQGPSSITDLISKLTSNASQPGGGTEQDLLRSLTGQNAVGSSTSSLGQSQSMINSIANNPALQSLLNPQGNATSTVNTLFDALNAKRQTQLGSDTRDLREQFSNMGLRSSTNYGDAATNLSARSDENLNAQMAQLLPQLAAQDTQSKTAGLGILSSLPGMLTNIGQTSGSLSLGQQGNIISALTNAGNLGTQGQSNATSALGAAGGLGVNQGQLGQTNLANLIAAAQGAGGLQNAGQSNQNSLASTLAQLGLNQRGQTGDLLSSLISGQSGAATSAAGNNTQGANILSQLFQGNQNNSLQALLGSSGALSSLSQLPYQLQGLQQGLAGGDINNLMKAYGLNQQSTDTANNLDANAYAEYQRTQSLIPQLMTIMAGAPVPEYAPSAFQQGTSAAGSAAGLYAVGKAMK